MSTAEQVVKGYPNGKMSKHMHGLEVGDSLEFKGPITKLSYTPNMRKKIGMVSFIDQIPASWLAMMP